MTLDDLDAGASWFNYLKKLRVDYLKIDGQFTCVLLGDRLNQAAIRCFQEVATAIGAQIIAEFVQIDHQRDALIDLGVGLGQGIPDPPT